MDEELLLHLSVCADASLNPPCAEKGGCSFMTLLYKLMYYVRRQEGQTMAEYGVVLAVITLGIVIALGFLSDDIAAALDRVGATLTP